MTRQIYFSAKADSNLYTNCLETVNFTVLENLEEIKEGAKRFFLEKEDENFLGGNETFNVTKLITPQ